MIWIGFFLSNSPHAVKNGHPNTFLREKSSSLCISTCFFAEAFLFFSLSTLRYWSNKHISGSSRWPPNGQNMEKLRNFDDVEWLLRKHLSTQFQLYFHRIILSLFVITKSFLHKTVVKLLSMDAFTNCAWNLKIGNFDKQKYRPSYSISLFFNILLNIFRSLTFAFHKHRFFQFH